MAVSRRLLQVKWWVLITLVMTLTGCHTSKSAPDGAGDADLDADGDSDPGTDPDAVDAGDHPDDDDVSSDIQGDGDPGRDFALVDKNPNSPTFEQLRRLGDMQGTVIVLYFSLFS